MLERSIKVMQSPSCAGCISDMRNPGFVFNLGLPEERSWPHTTYEPTLGPNPIQPGAQTNKLVCNEIEELTADRWCLTTIVSLDGS